MSFLKLNLLTAQISNNSKLLFTIDTRHLMLSAVINRKFAPLSSASGRAAKKGPAKKTSKPKEKFGAISEETYFYIEQQEQLAKLKKEFTKKAGVTSGKGDKSTKAPKKSNKRKFSKTVKKSVVENIFAGLLAKPKPSLHRRPRKAK